MIDINVGGSQGIEKCTGEQLYLIDCLYYICYVLYCYMIRNRWARLLGLYVADSHLNQSSKNHHDHSNIFSALNFPTAEQIL